MKRNLLLSAIMYFIVLTINAQNQKDNIFTDLRDSNVYRTVTIGNQVWMAENLRYLPDVQTPNVNSQIVSYYYVYGYNGNNIKEAKTNSNYKTHGVLYNWPASLNSCPTGWHLPTDAEWTQLTNYVGGIDAGGKLKDSDTIYWPSPNTGATNETGFKALPSGYVSKYGVFNGIGKRCFWWTTSEFDADNALIRDMSYMDNGVGNYEIQKKMGVSVRCVKN